jgi:transcriptional regulator with XRE-family HTH domain
MYKIRSIFEIHMTLGEKIKQLRKEKNWSQQVFGEKINIAKSVVWKYEKDEAIPSGEVIKRIATVFGISTDYLLFDRTERDNIAKITDKALLKQFEEVDSYTEEEREYIRYFLELAINNHKMKTMAV